MEWVDQKGRKHRNSLGYPYLNGEHSPNPDFWRDTQRNWEIVEHRDGWSHLYGMHSLKGWHFAKTMLEGHCPLCGSQ
jgi:hypothetical protein